ncbi:interleukin 4, isoform CRA_a [Rattus norvegicus]|uniref:Interleukin 4, isoform CRA_a n=1 Tax=Rattus norvegicus TaxID=10116 RepID=A6HED8_RAT|nr:interleukin 4, isoform CRA_a [Rattus norvegicus]
MFAGLRSGTKPWAWLGSQPSTWAVDGVCPASPEICPSGFIWMILFYSRLLQESDAG